MLTDRIDPQGPRPVEEALPGTSSPPTPLDDVQPATVILRRRTTPPPPDPDFQPTLPLSAALAERPVVPGYEILGEIGRGGMGVVYKARQLGLGRIVALKMLHIGPDSPGDALARFTSEAEAIARLAHPHIIGVHEVGTCPAGPYFVLEYAAGGNLASRLAGAPQPAVTAARVVRTLARAVHAAHERGIVHRDLKPANILLPEGVEVPLEGCTPKISDFGLARRLGEGSTLTLPGQVMGTPGYMPPEQASGPAGDVRPAADIWSLGVILYEMLTGRPPFCGSTAVETLHLMLFQEALPPSRLRRDLPRDLETICLHCLHKDPRNRYARAADLADDLDRFLDHKAIHARPTPAWERAVKWVRRRPGTAGLVASLLGMLILGLVLVTWQWLRAEAAHARSDRERERAVEMAAAEALARAEAQRLSARLLMERGVGLCEAGDSAAGLLWLVRSLETLPPGEAPLERSLRLLAGGWGRQLHALHGHHRLPRAVRAVAFTADGKTVAAACGPQVHFWDVRRRQPARAPLALPGKVLALFRTSAGLVAALRSPLSVDLYRVPAGTRLGSPLPVPAGARALALSHDGETALVGGNDPTARLFRVRDGKPLSPPWPHHASVRAVALSPDGRWAATGSEDRQVRLWSVPTGKLERVLTLHNAPVTTVAFSPDGRLVLSGCEDQRVCLWQRDSGALERVVRHEHAVTTAAFHPAGTVFATGSRDDSGRLWQLDGLPLGAPFRHADDVDAVAFTPDGGLLATGSGDGTLRLWKLDLGSPQRILRHPAPVNTLALSRSGSLLLTGCADARVRLWDLEKDTCRTVQEQAMALALDFTPDGRSFLVGSYEGQLVVLQTATGKTLGRPLGHSAALLCAGFSPDGRLVATGCEDGDKIIRLWDWRRGTVVHALAGHTRKVSSLAFSPDGRLLLSASWDRTARLWDVARGTAVGEPWPHRELVQSAVFAPDGTTALTGGDDYLARLWDVRAGQVRGVPLRHPDKVQTVAFAPGGEILATGGKGHQARLWDAATGKPLGPPLPHGWEVRALAFGPGGGSLWTASWDGTARRWRVPEPRREDVQQLRLWVEVHTGLRLDGTGAVVSLGLDEWDERMRALAAP